MGKAFEEKDMRMLLCTFTSEVSALCVCIKQLADAINAYGLKSSGCDDDNDVKCYLDGRQI